MQRPHSPWSLGWSPSLSRQVGPVTLNPSISYCSWSTPWSLSWSPPRSPWGSRSEWTCSFRPWSWQLSFGSNQSDNRCLGSHTSGTTQCWNSRSSNAWKCLRTKCLNVGMTVSTQYRPINRFIFVVGHLTMSVKCQEHYRFRCQPRFHSVFSMSLFLAISNIWHATNITI